MTRLDIDIDVDLAAVPRHRSRPYSMAATWLNDGVVAATLVFGSLLTVTAHAKDHEHPGDSEASHTAMDHGGHDHVQDEPVGHAHGFEIGIAPGLVYVPNESEITAGLHLHLVGALGESRWGLGGGVERLFDEHGHTTVSAVVQFRIMDPWSVILGPGVTFRDADPSAVEPSLHVETAYEFTFGHFHVGPALEVAIDPDATHLTLGAHLGVGF
jgi:hypothetical protein